MQVLQPTPNTPLCTKVCATPTLAEGVGCAKLEEKCRKSIIKREARGKQKQDQKRISTQLRKASSYPARGAHSMEPSSSYGAASCSEIMTRISREGSRTAQRASHKKVPSLPTSGPCSIIKVWWCLHCTFHAPDPSSCLPWQTFRQ